jgi:A/G-specific adenine glycosylase
MKPKPEAPHIVHAAAVVVRRVGNPPREQVLLAKRPSKGLLGGMWEFPNGRVEGDPRRGLAKALKTGCGLRVRAGEALGVIRHAYTHVRVTVHVFRAELIERSENRNLRWVAMGALGNYPMGSIDRQIARKLGR